MRPAITVLIASGDYFYGQAGADHLSNATRYSHTALATFDEADSGSSADAPITYRGAPGVKTAPRFIGGVPLSGLVWSPAAGPSGTTTFSSRFQAPSQTRITDILHVEPAARTHTAAPHYDSHCHQLHVVLTLQFCVTGRSMDLISIEDEAVAKAR